jgi:hypothetical protein
MFVLSIMFCLAMAALAWLCWQRLDEADGTRQRFWLLGWAGKGLLVPVLFWLGLNSGLAPGLPPFLPEIEAAKSGGGSWGPVFCAATAPGLLVLGSHWIALTLGWLAVQLAHRREDWRQVTAGLLGWALLMLPVCGVVFYFCGRWGLGLAAALWLGPVAYGLMTDPLATKPIPLYSGAIGKMKFGKYHEAELEVIKELEKCEDDFAGWLLLAELYATAFRDLAAADQTVHDLCAQPNVTASDVAVALHRLSDWYLKVGEDPVGARRVLAEISARLPGTHLDKMARLRLEQIPASREELAAQRPGKVFRLPALSDQAAAGPALTREQATAQAGRWVTKLQQNPDDAEARENLARLLAERLGQTDPALDQLDLLLAMPDQPERKRAEWLGQKAAWQLKEGHDLAAGQTSLEHLIQEYPQSPQAFAAQQRLSMMAVEARLRKARETAPTALRKWGLDEH